MVFENIWNVWPLKFFSSQTSRRCRSVRSTSTKHSRSSSNIRSQSEPLIRILGPWESNIVTLQSLLIWEKPGRSITAVLTANIIYWYLAYSEMQIFYVISLFGLAFFLHHQWVYLIWPEISVPKVHCDQEDWTPVHPSVLSAPEVSRYLKNCCNYIKEQQKSLSQLRRKQPGWFCLVMVSLFSLLWLLGHFISGVIFLYALLMGIMCGPAFVIYFIPKSTLRRTEDLLTVLFKKNEENVDCIEQDLAEFLPEESLPEVQLALGIPLTRSELPEERRKGKGGRHTRNQRVKGQHSAANISLEDGASASAFASGLSAADFPSLDETVAGDAEIDESDLQLSLPPTQPHDAMRFVASHFADSDSEDSSDGDEFSCGLSFRAATAGSSDGAAAAAATAAALTSLGRHLAAAVALPSGSVTPEALRSSSTDDDDDDEFELISDDDLH